MTEMRLSKLMALRGLCSRREADAYIEQGLVRVDGRVIDTLGTRVREDVDITLAPAARQQQSRLVTVLLNKPIGHISGHSQRGGDGDRRYPAAAELIIAANHYQGDRSRAVPDRKTRSQLAPAGRLDIDSHGLLVLTQDGRIARRLVGADSGIEKEYLVRISGSPSESALRRLRHGLQLDGRELKPAKVEQLDDGLLKMTLIEGRKRQIRRMCELVGLEVAGLKRTRIGRIGLGALPRGQWRYLKENEYF